MSDKTKLIKAFIIIISVVSICSFITIFFMNNNNVNATQDYWISCYDAFNNNTKVNDQYVVSGTTINVYKAEHLAYIAWYVNNGKTSPYAKGFQGYTIVLKSGMDLSQHYWNPIGSYTSSTTNYPLRADFDGNNCIITNLNLGNTYSGQYLSFIGYTTGNVSNVCIYGISFPSNISYNASCIVGRTTGNITHCQAHNESAISLKCNGSSTHNIAGICSYFGGTKISSCNNIVSITTNDNGSDTPLTITCGICSYVENGEISQCINQVNITSNGKYGISAGICRVATGSVNNCENSGIIKSDKLYSFGIAYSYNSVNIYNCSNFGKIQSPAGSYGICYNASQVYNCYNKGIIQMIGTYNLSDTDKTTLDNTGVPTQPQNNIYAGGSGICNNASTSVKNCINIGNLTDSTTKYVHLCGIANTSPTIQYCKNAGNISTASGCSGIALIASGKPFSIEYCENSGTISSSKNQNGASGFFAYDSYLYSLNINHCINSGNISGSSAGGISDSLYNGGNLSASNYIIQNCANYGTITATGRIAAGIIGASIYITIKNCYNAGNVTNSSNDCNGVGGIIGELSSGKAYVVGCNNVGNISAKTNVGGIVGYAGNKDINVFSCCNYGTITSTGTKDYYEGGIIGRAKNNDPTAQYNANCGDCKYDNGNKSNKSNFGNSNGKGIDNATKYIKNNLKKHELNDVYDYFTSGDGYTYLKNNYSLSFQTLGSTKYKCIGNNTFTPTIFTQTTYSKHYQYSIKTAKILNTNSANMDNSYHLKFKSNSSNYISIGSYNYFPECYWENNSQMPTVS